MFCRFPIMSFSALCFSLTIGCGSDGGASSSEENSSASDGRGTPACQDWQDAACDFIADECNFYSRAECDAQFQGVVCKSDQQASDCSNTLNKAQCGTSIEGCQLVDVADSAPAIKMCDDLTETVCSWQARCGDSRSLAECKEAYAAKIDCNMAVSVNLQYETCIRQVKAQDCARTTLPPSCDNAVTLK